MNDNFDKLQYHIRLRGSDIGKYVLLPGDPGRCELIASYLEQPVFVTRNREFTTYTGSLLGEKVSVVSTGIGCPSTAIAVEELIKIGAHTFIRIGTSGAMQKDIKTGDLGIVSGAIRDEGTTSHYLPIEFPAVANVDVVLALRTSAEALDANYHIGICHSKDSFFGEVESERMPVADRLQTRWQAWVKGGAICSEMESAALFIIASIHNKRAGGIMLMFGQDQPVPDPEKEEEANSLFDIKPAIKVAVEGLKLLIANDKLNKPKV